MINGYRDLIVWQKSMDLVDEIYKLIKLLPSDERFSLSDQMRRSAISVPSNIAEGYERKSKKEYLQFLSIAKGSRAELETQLYICIRQNYITQAQAYKAFGLCNEVGRILNTLINKENH
ncbi:MAG: four helix bundle protein [Clostridia bacterium]|nr:four helix bundle protein [Clostridia bacterium]